MKLNKDKGKMTKRQNDRKTESPNREASLVKMNDISNGDLKHHMN